MKVDGHCFCEFVTYRATVNPEQVYVCHCSDCQTHSGSAYGVVVGIVDEDFELLIGTLKTYSKVAASGTVRALTFCPKCGTRIHASTVGEGTDFFGLRVGTVTQRDQLKPTWQSWCQSAQDWVQDLSDIPKV